jgi:hypothetical protein
MLTFLRSAKGVTLILIALTLLDVGLASFALIAPQRWFLAMHGQPYADPAGLLARTGAIWAAFALLQLIATVRWQRSSLWLPLVAGVRLTELFSDWTYLLAADATTIAGKIGMLSAPVVNLVVAIYLIRRYRAFNAPETAARSR